VLFEAAYDLDSAAFGRGLSPRTLREWLRRGHQAGRDCGLWVGHWILTGAEVHALLERHGQRRGRTPTRGSFRRREDGGE
jgi:hypothetical protein